VITLIALPTLTVVSVTLSTASLTTNRRSSFARPAVYSNGGQTAANAAWTAT
jgi:hypothetical protein